MSRRLEFSQIATAALRSAPAIVARVLPGGRTVGTEYVARNPNRADRRPGSLKVNLRTGRWADFATADSGGDLISLVAWRYRVGQADAARQLAAFLNISTETRS